MSVHPRVCGEQNSMPLSIKCLAGSSPRVRGTVCEAMPLESTTRFIPACAGNRRLSQVMQGGVTVHPRVCGEQVRRFTASSTVSGSSPRVRGTDRFQSVILLFKTVHPRVCGEQSLTLSRTGFNAGSSPRVRGTGASLTCQADKERFIPACAGNRH